MSRLIIKHAVPCYVLVQGRRGGRVADRRARVVLVGRRLSITREDADLLLLLFITSENIHIFLENLRGNTLKSFAMVSVLESRSTCLTK